MNHEVVSWFLMAIGVAELFAAIVMHHKASTVGGEPADVRAATRKRKLTKSSYMVGLSGIVAALIGIAIQMVP